MLSKKLLDKGKILTENCTQTMLLYLERGNNSALLLKAVRRRKTHAEGLHVPRLGNAGGKHCPLCH